MKESERKEAKKAFGGKAGKAILKQMANTFTPGEGLQDQINSRFKDILLEIFIYTRNFLYQLSVKGTLNVCFRNKGGLSEQEKAKIKEAILAASSLEEVERLQQQLQAGIISFTGRNFIFN